jgi:hypothetical protein
MTIQPLLDKIQEVINSSMSFGINKWYADDGNILLPFHLMTAVLQILQNDGPSYGYFIKFSKCKYLIGYCDNQSKAIKRKRNLI